MRYVGTAISIRQAFKEVKAFEWDGEYRAAARAAIKALLEEKMESCIDDHLEEMEIQGIADRRNGHYERHILTESGDVVVAVQRTRLRSAQEVLKTFGRRSAVVDRMILECFVLGLSTRKVGRALLGALGEKVSAATVSKVARQLDGAVAAYHGRVLSNRHRFLLLDGVVLKNRTGAGARKRVVLVALGITATGKKEVIDFKLAFGESQGAWESFLNDLYRRGLTGEGVDLIVVDGGKGLLASLGLCYGTIPVQRCWAHKTRNVLNHVRMADQEEVTTDLHTISHAAGIREAQKMFRRFVFKWSEQYPKAVECLQKDMEDLCNFFSVPDSSLWRHVRTTNAIERRFVEVRRRTRPMGVFSDRTSMERILFAIFTYENSKEGTATPLLLTQKS
jgi:transposase-like protein